MLDGRRIVLGVTGGIAAYKSCDLVSRLKKRGAEVRVVMTAHACEFVQPLTFATLCGCPAYTDTFSRKHEIEHVTLAKWGELFVVAPATANCLGKFAAGIADDLLTTSYLAATCPVLLAPAMNAAMWRHPATQANVETLRARGVRFVGPERGHLACGDADVGRMSEPEAIVEAIEAILNPRRDLEGLNLLVTAGPTVEKIDPVRYITNRSTGKMGYAIAEAAAARGAHVTLVSGPTNLVCPAGVERVDIASCAELCEAVLSRGEAADAVIQAAAPADFRPKTVSDTKIKKTGAGMALELEATTDIAAELGRRKKSCQVLVGFAAETDGVLENARAKLDRKNCDLIVANDVSRSDAGFGVDTNVVTLIDRDGAVELPKLTKREVADAILDRVQKLWKR